MSSSTSTTTNGNGSDSNNNNNNDIKKEEDDMSWYYKAAKLANNRDLRTRKTTVLYDERFEDDFEWIQEEEYDDAENDVGAEAAGITPNAMTEFELKRFPNYAKHPGKRTTFLSIRNHLLTQWEKQKTQAFLTKEKALSSVRRPDKETGNLLFDFLEKNGFINYGALPRTIKPPKPNEENRVIIIGAGMAGVTAASQLTSWGHEVIILEARDRIGGRMHSDRSFKQTVDLGASIVTGTKGNPVYTVCKQLNLELHTIEEHCPIYDPSGKMLPPDTDRLIEQKFNAHLEAANKLKGPANVDRSLGEMLKKFLDGESEEERNLLNWHVANLEYACAIDLNLVSLNEWDQDDGYEFVGEHFLVNDGYASIPEGMAKKANLDVRFNKVVKSVSYAKTGVKVITENGESYSGKYCLCTLPLGVLKRNLVDFQPPLPEWKENAIKRLGFGLLNKVALQFSHAFWESKYDYFAHTTTKADSKGECFLFWDMQKCMNAPILVGLIAGRSAYEIEKEEKEQVFQRAMAMLKKVFGEVPQPEKYVVTAWASDPFAYGSYSYIAVGGNGADYDLMAKPVINKVFFAGEATNRHHPATVAGAFVSGLRAAAKIDKASKPTPRRRKKKEDATSTPDGKTTTTPTSSASSSSSTSVSSPSPSPPSKLKAKSQSPATTNKSTTNDNNNNNGNNSNSKNKISPNSKKTTTAKEKVSPSKKAKKV